MPLCRWQIATASASAASCGFGIASRPSSSFTICADLRLLRAAVADHRALDLRGGVFDDRHAGLDRRQHGHAARVPELQALRTFIGVKEVFDGDALGPACSRAAPMSSR